MKKIFTHILSVLMAVLVFYGGAGVNIISYCCGDCRSAGIEALLKDKCCEIHHHAHHHDAAQNDCGKAQDDCHKAKGDCHKTKEDCGKNGHCSPKNACQHQHTAHTKQNGDDSHHSHTCESCVEHSSGSCCNMERVSFDWSSQCYSEQNIDLSPVVLDLLSADILNISPTLLTQTDENTGLPNGPPLICPRDYLSILTVLLI